MRILLHVFGIRLDQQRLPEGGAKAKLLRAIEKTQAVLTPKGALRVLGLSSSRYHQWRNSQQRCDLDDHDSCPRSKPTRLTADEVLAMKSMMESAEYRHVPTGRLAILAQRLGKVFAAPATWYRLARERGWRRPRNRVYPAAPKDGIRASKLNEYWHIDTTIIKLLDGSKIYLHAVIDNFFRKILAWRVAEHFETASTIIILKNAVKLATGDHHLNTLDSAAAVRKLVSFYVSEYNATIPHSAFQGPTPDEVYSGTGSEIPAQLVQATREACQARRQTNRALSCEQCWTNGQSVHTELLSMPP